MAKDGTNRGGARPGAGRKKKTPEGTYEHVTFTAEQLKELTDSPHVSLMYLARRFHTRKHSKQPHGKDTATASTRYRYSLMRD
jgi:hypothetical protein